MLSAAFLLGHRKRLGTFSGTFGSCSCGNVACADFAAGALSPPCQGTALCCCGLLHANVLLTRSPVARLCLEMRSWVTRLLAPGDEGTRSDRADKDLCGVSGGRGDSFGMPAGMSTESFGLGQNEATCAGQATVGEGTSWLQAYTRNCLQDVESVLQRWTVVPKAEDYWRNRLNGECIFTSAAPLRASLGLACAQATTLAAQVFGKGNPRSRAGRTRA